MVQKNFDQAFMYSLTLRENLLPLLPQLLTRVEFSSCKASKCQVFFDVRANFKKAGDRQRSVNPR